MEHRVVVLIDMDCFYCQVEEQLDSNLKGKPIAVVQYNTWRGGGIIAVNYPAREKGVTRHMKGDEAKQKCPEIVLARVPEVRGKADLTKYREAGKRVAEVLHTFTPLLERASVDEAYLDLTEVVEKRLKEGFDQITIDKMQNTYVVGYETTDFLHNVSNNREYCESNCKLTLGGLITEEIRAEVYKRTGYQCSAGIAHNKILAKLVCGLHKPNKQTILPHESISELYKDLPVRKIKSLGGKFGSALSEELKISYMGELIKFSEKELAKRFDEKTARFVYNIARGIDLEPVTKRLLSKSIGCCKKFPGKGALVTPKSVEHWMNELAAEISERLEKDLEENNRKATQIIISFAQQVDRKDVSSSRTQKLTSYDSSDIAQNGLDLIRKCCLKPDGKYKIKFLGLSVGNFKDNKKGVDIKTFFKNKIETNTHSPKSEIREIIEPNINLNSCKLNPLRKEVFNNHENVEINSNEIQIRYNVSEYEKIIEERNSENENLSVYSATTQELNEDIKNLIYYEDIYPESICHDAQNSQDNASDIARKFVNSKVYSDNSNSSNDMLETRASSSKSFFTKYFESYTTDESNSSPDKRNIDIVKDNEENNLEYSAEYVDFEKTPKISQNNAYIEEKEVNTDFDLLETCLECNKKILSSELVSHMDYHYALKIVKDEAHLYKSQINTASKKVKIDKGAKRKLATQIKPIFTFVQQDKLNDGNSEMCSECNKRIKLEDIISHKDYHLAKKLNLELNYQNTCPTPDKSNLNKSTIKANRKTNKDSKNVTNMGISTFFKQ